MRFICQELRKGVRNALQVNVENAIKRTTNAVKTQEKRVETMWETREIRMKKTRYSRVNPLITPFRNS